MIIPLCCGYCGTIWIWSEPNSVAASPNGGACTVHLDGNAARSCSLPVSAVGDKAITTIEGLSEDGSHPVQQAWKEIDVPQCGYCQAGQIMTATAFLAKNPNPSEEEIKNAMHGNICRCATYNRIQKAVALAAEKMA